MNIKDTFEQLAQSLVMLDLTDLPALAEVHTYVENISEYFKEKSLERSNKVANSIVDIITDIILSESESPDKDLILIGETLDILQKVEENSKLDNTIKFPDAFTEKENDNTDKQQSVLESLDEDLYNEFFSQQALVLAEIEEIIVDLEISENTKDDIAILKRHIHTLKGESGMLGFYDVEKLCHHVEDKMEELPIKNLTDGLFAVKDWLEKSFNFKTNKSDEEPEPYDKIIELFNLDKNDKNKDVKLSNMERKEERKVNTISKFKIPTEIKILDEDTDFDLLADFVGESREHLDQLDEQLLILEEDSKNDDALSATFRAFHTIKGSAGFLELEELQILAHQAENLLDKARKGELDFTGKAVDVIFTAIDKAKELLQLVENGISSGCVELSDNLTELLEEIIVNAEGSIAKTTENKEVAKSAENKEVAKSAENKEVAKSADSINTKTQNKRSNIRVKEAVKVDTEKLNKLIDIIGEIVIAETMVSQSKELKNIMSPALTSMISQLDKITRELQEVGTSLRMMPINPVFKKMARLVRDLSKKTNKKVNFIISGGETELDKSVVDKIGDPLVHMVRNAVDHGIEPDINDRIKAGKNPKANIELRAFHRGGNIYIELEDDGRGLNKDAILSKAIERGIIKENDVLSDREIFSLIFEAGFSTAKKVTDVSGRGVGMDVVRKNIEILRGVVEITSKKGVGTTFSIRLPLTLAIIDGMVVEIAEERYIIPTLSIVRSISVKDCEISTILNKGEMVKINDEMIPVFRMENLFGINQSKKKSDNDIVVITEENNKKVGFIVNKLMGQQQVVIKAIADDIGKQAGVSGGAIMPDGQVGLILDVGGLVKLAHK